MPRRYRHKVGTPYRCNYSNENLEKALQAVVDDQLSLRQAAERYGVPKSTLFRKYHGQNGDILGRPPVLSAQEENSIKEALLTAADFGYPFTHEDLCLFVQHYLNNKGSVTPFNDNLPGKDWLQYFLSRNNDLSVRMSENVKHARAEVSPAVIRTYFNNLERTIADVPPCNIINYDETNISDDPGKARILVKRGSKRAPRIIDSSKSSTSVMFAIAGDGQMLPPYVVYKATNLYPEWVQNGPPGAAYNRSQSGWFDAIIFEDWFDRIALPYFRRKDGSKVLIGDNLSSHLCESIIRKCRENDIRFTFLPPNSTHLCQPLDVSVFGPMKKAWRQVLTKWKMRHRGTVPKGQFPSLLQELMTKISGTLPENIKSGFAACGIIPFNPQRVEEKLLKYATKTVNANALTKSFTAIIEKNVGSSSTPKKTRKKKINVEAGKSIVEEDLPSSRDVDFVEQGRSEESDDRLLSTIPKTPEREVEEEESDMSTEESEPKTKQNNHNLTKRISNKLMTKVTSCDNLIPGLFILVTFIYNENTKKVCKKDFVAQILSVDQENNSIKVDCMRSYKGDKKTFIFPTIRDITQITLTQIKCVLSSPVICRGRHTFEGDIF